MNPCITVCFILSILASQNHGARILSLIPFPGRSHYINIQPIMQELALRGHDVTVVTTNYEKDPLPNYHQIILDQKTFWDAFGKKVDKFAFENMAFPKEMKLLWDAAYFSTEVAFNSTSLQEFIQNDHSEFDLVFIELFYMEALYMFAHKYQAPIVTISTMGFTQYVGESMGNPLHMSYMPHEFLPTEGKLSLYKRIENTFYTMFDLIGRKVYNFPRHQQLVERHFKNLPQPLPSLADIEKNISVVLTNTHYSIDTIKPTVPGIIDIGGAHIKKPKPLTIDLQKFIDEAKHGVIFFSLGSNIKSNEMPKDKMQMFLKVLGSLKARVLWKWEDDHLPNKPDNVHIGKWLPQTDILAHPNVKAFITHGGLLSFLEAVHFGVPIIGLPVYGDQHLNTAKAETLGFGIKLTFSSLTEESLTLALDQILNNPQYRDKAGDLSKKFRDRPLSPMDTAIYWIEYVIRHKGAKFMASPVLNFNWYELYMVDALLIFLVIVFSVVLVKCMAVRFIWRKLFGGNKQKSDMKMDQKKKN